MDNLLTVFSQADNFILWANALFFAGFLFVQSSFYLLMDLNKIKIKAIDSIYEEMNQKNSAISPVEFIDRLYLTSKVLVLPALINDIHYKTAMIAIFIVGIISIFNKTLSGALNIPAYYFYMLYLPVLGYGISFLVYKFALFRHYFRLQKKYIEISGHVSTISIGNTKNS